MDRRTFLAVNYFPEKRNGKERRNGPDRRQFGIRPIRRERRSPSSLHSHLKRLLLHRLKNNGIEQSVIPGFIRNLANSLFSDPDVNLNQLNKRLHYLGWEDFELDYHTFQLAISCFESEGIESVSSKPGEWFESNFI